MSGHIITWVLVGCVLLVFIDALRAYYFGHPSDDKEKDDGNPNP